MDPAGTGAGDGPVSVVTVQPPWVVRLAVAAGALVLTGLVLLLLVPALVAAVVVFVLAALVAAAQSRVRRLVFPRGGTEGRRNVRVIERRDA